MGREKFVLVKWVVEVGRKLLVDSSPDVFDFPCKPIFKWSATSSLAERYIRRFFNFSSVVSGFPRLLSVSNTI